MNCVICDKKLRKHNKIGTCRKHRGQSKIRRAYENAWKEVHKPQYIEAKRRWTLANLDYFVEYRNRDITKKLAHALRVRLRKAVKQGSAIKNLGCSVSELKLHLERLFVDGMSWENYGKWHIDHIKPLSSFNLLDPQELIQACHYTNLQPLWGIENSRKHAKLDYIPKSAGHGNP